MDERSIIVNRIAIKKKLLSQIPDDERNLLFMMGHIRNELSILNKLHWFSANYDVLPQTPEEHVHISQALTILKLLLGKQIEAWNFIRAIFLGTDLGKSYVPRLESEAQEALDALKKFFGPGSPLLKIRNEYAFHYPAKDWSQQLSSAFDKIDEGECLFYVSESSANTHWFGAEVVLNYALLGELDSANSDEALNRLMDESLELNGWLTKVADHTIVAVVQQHFGFDYIDEIIEPVEVKGVPDGSTFSLPFFIHRGTPPNE